VARVLIRLPEPHDSQLEVLRGLKRFNVLACGRRWGKTVLGVGLSLTKAARGERVWWVAPTYQLATVGWKEILNIINDIPGVKVSRGTRDIILPGGGGIGVRSAHNPDHLRGVSLDFVIIDEASLVPEEAWEAVLRPTLADRRGGALIISTPKGRNWFYRLWLKGQEDGRVYKSWRFPTSANPYIPPDEIEEARRSLSDRFFRQEFLAEFLDDLGGVFRNVNDAVKPVQQDGPVQGHTYVVGVDWGKIEDFTAFVVVDVTISAVVHAERMRQVDYALQVGRLEELVSRWRPSQVVAEENSMGTALIEDVVRRGIPVVPFQTTAASKRVVIEGLSLAIERGDLAILPHPELINELRSYEARRLPSGIWRYSAPEGYHDDYVMALALAWWGARRGSLLIDFV